MKKLAISFGIGAVIGRSFTASTTKANKKLYELKKEIVDLNSKSKKIEGFRTLGKSLFNTTAQINSTKEKMEKLKKEFSKPGSKKAIKEYKKLGKSLKKLESIYNKQKLELKDSNKSLKKQGFNVKKLGTEYKNLSNQIEKANKKQTRMNKLNSISTKRRAISSGSGKALGTGVGMIAMLVPAIKTAIDSESQFADVKKQIDFKNKEEEKTYRDSLESLITKDKIAISMPELYSSAANTAQSGVEKNEVIEYVKAASKMGVAFDSSREEATKMMLGWRNAFGKTLPEIKELTDQVNFLGNTTGAKATDIGEFINRVGNIGTVAGFSSGAISAIGASLIEQNMAPEVAATGAKKIMNAMTKGFSATSGQKEIYTMLGLNSETLAAEAQKDAEGTILKILKKIKSMPKEKQGAILNQLFGEEGMRGAAGLLKNIDKLQKNFNKVKDKKNYNKSTEQEYLNQKNTRKNQIEVLKNLMAINIRNFGETLLPTVNSVVEKITIFSTKLLDFQKKHPKLFSTLAKTILGVGAALTTVGIIGKGVGAAMSAVTFIASPIGMATLAVGALIAVGVALWQNWDKIKAKGYEIVDGLKSKWGSFVEWFKAKVSGIKDFFKDKIKNSLVGKAFLMARKIQNERNESLAVPGYATGGVITKPTLAMVGEGGYSETIIPHKKDMNSLNLWKKTGQFLGAYENKSSSNTFSPVINFTFSPVINAKDSRGVEEILAKEKKNSFEEFRTNFKRLMREELRKGNGR